MVTRPRNADGSTRPLIAILLGAPLTAQNFRRTGIPDLSKHFDVVVVDCNRWLRKGYGNLRFQTHDYADVVSVSTAAEFGDAIARLTPAYAIDFIGLDAQTRFIQTVLRAHSCRFVVQKTGAVPAARNNTLRVLALLWRHPRVFVRKIVGRLQGIGRKPLRPDVALLAGRRSLDSFTSSAHSVLWVGSLDYHTYLAARVSSAHDDVSQERSRYILFIDDCIAVASDFALLGLSPPVDATRYFALLRECFDRIERLTGAPVIVAAHPNGRDVTGYPSLFGGRQTYFDRTVELSARSEMVLSHLSTALSYAALGNKPVVILTSKELDNSTYGPSVRETSAQLRCPLLFMEADDDAYRSACGARVDREAYRKYVENFVVTPDVDEDAPWRTFMDFVQQNWSAAKPSPTSPTPSGKV